MQLVSTYTSSNFDFILDSHLKSHSADHWYVYGNFRVLFHLPRVFMPSIMLTTLNYPSKLFY